VVSLTLLLLYPRGNSLTYPLDRKGSWVSEPVSTVCSAEKCIAPAKNRNPLLYRLRRRRFSSFHCCTKRRHLKVGTAISSDSPKCHFTATCVTHNRASAICGYAKNNATCRQQAACTRDVTCSARFHVPDPDTISGAATRLRLNNRGIVVRFSVEKTASRPATLLPGVDRPRHKPPSSAEVKNVCRYTATPPHAFMVWCPIKRSDKSTLTRADTVSLQ
jgi:hypothetical protein